MSASLFPSRLGGAVATPIRLGARLGFVIAAFIRKQRIRRDLACVAEMSSRELADIGIGPGGQEGAVRFGRRMRGGVGDEVPDPAMWRDRSALPASWTEWR